MVKRQISLTIEIDLIDEAQKHKLNISAAAAEGVIEALNKIKEAPAEGAEAYEKSWTDRAKLMELKEREDYARGINKQAEALMKEDRKTWNKTYLLLKAKGKLPEDLSVRNEKRILIYKELLAKK